MYADPSVFASQRLKPAKTRLMTVEIDPHFMRAQTLPPSSMNNGSPLPMGTPSIVSMSGTSSFSNTSPTSSAMSVPIGNGSIINKKADPAQGLYQTCLTLRERLRDVPDFEKFLEPPEDADPDMPEDPVTQLWRCFRMGSSLCVLFNACRPVELIHDNRLSPNLKTLNDCKAATFHFLKGIKQELGIDGDDAFMIHNLYSDDTNGFVKVTKTVSKILDHLKQRNLLLNRGSSDQSSGTGDKKPLDNRARVVQELVDTERKYVQDLEALQEYMRSLEINEIISKDTLHNMFLNLNQLVDFQRRFLIRVETQNDLPAELQKWGKLFMQYEKSFTVYEPYASNFNAAQNLAQDERDKLARMSHPVFDQLAAFLIKPVQRITKYPLLLRDLIKHSDSAEAESKQLHEGLSAIERITTQINEAIRKSENVEVVKDLEGRVEDWKGHKLEHFGDLLLHGQFCVIKGDAKQDSEREYHIYLFERILLCCKDAGGASKKANKTMSMGKNSKIAPKKKAFLQLKGRIFMQNVTDVVSLARNGNYTLQIYWKGDPGVENFVIKHNNEEGLNQWKNALQKQRELYKKEEEANRGRSSGQSVATQFVWMQTNDSEPAIRTPDGSDDEDDLQLPGTGHVDGYASQYTVSMSRNASSTSLRSRSATNERMPQQMQPPPPAVPTVMDTHRGLPRFPHPALAHAPPLTLNTNAGLGSGSHSPERNASYFSPTAETPMTARTSSSSAQYPFPRQPTPNGMQYDDPNRYTPPNMSRTSSREGAALTPTNAYQSANRGMQRPSLPGMANAPPATQQQIRMRSASSPNIHHLPVQTRSPGGTIPAVPPVPSMPQGYVPYTGGPAKINRSNNNSPTSPGLPIQGTRPLSPTGSAEMQLPLQDLSSINGSMTPLNGGGAARSTQSQVKVKIHYNNDKLAIIVPYSIRYSQLMDRVERKVRMCTNGPEFGPSIPIRIRYQDEDGDYISMNSDDDVQMAFDVACDPAQKDSTGTCGAITLYVQVG